MKEQKQAELPNAIDDAIAFQKRIREDPKWYFNNYLGIPDTPLTWWEGMDRMLTAIPRAIKERKPVVIGSGHALSKDFTMSGGLPLWFIHAYGPDCQVAMTAPTDRQVRKVMWKELSSRYNGRLIKDDFGRLLECELQLTKDCFVLAFTTKETGGQIGKFQGFHAPAIMVLISEAQAVSDSIFDQIDGILTSEVQLFVVLGNPITTTGRYVQMLRDKVNNIVINLSCLDSPNVKSKKNLIPGVCSYPWVADKAKRWNMDGSGKDPRWMGRVLGLVPTTSINTVISFDLWMKAVKRNVVAAYDYGSIGVDPALEGDDDMAISVFRNGEEVEKVRIPKCEAPEGCAHIQVMQQRHFPHGQIPIVIECDGLGAPFAHFLKKMIPQQLQCEIIQFYASSTDHKKINPQYKNARAELAFIAQEEILAGNVKFMDDQTTQEEATAEMYYETAGKIILEPKNDIKERLGRSPNSWDATKLAVLGNRMKRKITVRSPRKDAWADDIRQTSMAPQRASAMAA